MHSSRKNEARRQRERQVIDEGVAIWKVKRKRELLWEAEEKKLNREMLATYNPWGKPGNGAPMPGALRKTKWILEDSNIETNPRSVMTWGRPGHGAPMKTSAGNTWAYIKSDPLIRFQMHDAARIAVENELRYKSTPHDKENYRRELDSMVYQKAKTKNLENAAPNDNDSEGEKPYPGGVCHQRQTDMWGRPGPGGRIWRNPNKSGRNFFTSMGWTNENVFRKFDRERKKQNIQEQIYEITGGGVELVPLLAKRRMIKRCPLTSTDITKMFKICDQFSKYKLPASDYFRQLCCQVEEKEKHKQLQHQEEMMQNNKHFETWQDFWGRPGHGAPKLLNQRENLEFLLYRKPSQRPTCFTKKSQ